jgi:MFS family permease
VLAGALLQWPIGRLSDTMDRRRALALVTATAAAGALLMAVFGTVGAMLLVGAAIFGGAAFAVYPVVVAHLVDHLHQEEILSGNAGVLLLHGAGAAVGPALAGLAMGWLGAAALPLFIALMFGPTAVYALLASRRGDDQIVDEAAHFVPMLRTSPTVLEMMTPEQAPPPAQAPADTAAGDAAAAAEVSVPRIHGAT